MARPIVLEVRNLKTYFRTRTGIAKAVDGVSFTIREGEVLGLVGESGSGKSMTALSLLRLVPEPSGRIVDGEVLLDGEDLLKKTDDEMRRIRGRRISMILQDPMTSLNPILTIGDQLTEAPRAEDHVRPDSARARAIDLLGKVRISSPADRMRNYPHQMSGGMRQRVVGAIAISRIPRVLIADEPTTSLDATTQLQYLHLLKEIQQTTGVAMLFITHDFGIVSRICDRVAVMYAGRIVETASTPELFSSPSHPYTQGLLNSVPNVHEDVEFLSSIEGHPPRVEALPPGCTFAPRCPYAFERCQSEYPPEFTVGEQHLARCWLLDGKSQ
jgi:oligopeptide/dipeptide ABC transporter ATP-binding protein